jgi:SAM-dependent methyltransferase
VLVGSVTSTGWNLLGQDEPVGTADRRLVDDERLASSSVVANCAMNRERGLTGVNSYTRELGFDPVEVLLAATPGTDGRVGWLDLCCGSGRALIEAADRLRVEGAVDRVELVGLDLVDAFLPHPPEGPPVLVEGAIAGWTPERAFDLITCVHGLHYVGDVLGALCRAAGWLTPTGRLVADFDTSAVRRPDGEPAGRRLTAALRAAGFDYDARRRRISRTGGARVSLPYAYLGADDRAGPNYTGQPAVRSHYRAPAGPGSARAR